MRFARAAISVALLVGFYVFAAAIIAGFAFAGLALNNVIGFKMLIVAGVVGFVVLRAMFWISRSDPVDESTLDGITVTEKSQPRLWAEVRALAESVGTRPPDEIHLVPEVNASVSEDASWLGLKAGNRRMMIGIPLLIGLDTDQMRAVLAHELGHYSGSHTRLGPVIYRGRVQIGRTIAGLDNHPITRWMFKGYAWLFLVVSQKVSRQQEFEADAAAARIASPSALVSALRELEVLDAVWNFYLNGYVGWAVNGNVRPSQLVLGYASVLTDPERAHELAEARATDREHTPSRYDSHPTFAQRAAALAAFPEPAETRDKRPASSLLDDADEVMERASSVFLSEHMLELRAVPWEEVAPAAGQAMMRPDVERVQAAAKHLLDGRQPTVAGVIDLLHRHHDLAARIISLLRAEGMEVPEGVESAVFVDSVASYLSWMGAAAGSLHWRLNWGGPALLVTEDGTAVDLAEMIGEVVEKDPPPVTELRASIERLGIPLDAFVRAGRLATPAAS